MPNAIAMDVLDTAQLNPAKVLKLVQDLDMAAVTIVQGTYPKEAMACAQLIHREAPKVMIGYRIIRDDLKDEDAPFKQTPQQWCDRFALPLDLGFYCAVFNESLANPMSAISKFSVECLNLTAIKGQRTMHFKVSPGNPGQGQPRDTRPDGYAEMDDLWKSIAKANKPFIDAGQFPLAIVAPHEYFAFTGPINSVTGRFKNIYRRLDAQVPPIDHKYVPMHIGETGIMYVRPDGSLDSGKGYLNVNGAVIADRTYAQLWAQVMIQWYMQDDVVNHAFAVGHSVGGDFASFDLLDHDDFWNELKTIANKGILRLKRWYGNADGPYNPPPPVTPPPVVPTVAVLRSPDGKFSVRVVVANGGSISFEVLPQ